MLWIRLEPTVFDHRKTVRLSLLLGLRETHLVGHLTKLWTWALSSAASGDLDAMGALEAAVIARVADWTGDLLDLADAETFVGALLEVGFLDRLEDGGLRLHGWRERHELWADRREREAEATPDPDSARKRQHAQAQAAYRARKKTPPPNPLPGAERGSPHSRGALRVIEGDHRAASRVIVRDGQVMGGDGSGDHAVTASDVTVDQHVTAGDVTRDEEVIEGDITGDRGVTSRVMAGDITRDAPDRTGPGTGPEITGPETTPGSPPVPPAAAVGRPPTPRTRGAHGRGERNRGSMFDAETMAAAVTSQWLRWRPDDGERPPWAAWVRSRGRGDLVDRPPPDALVAAVAESMARGRANGSGVRQVEA